MYLVMKHFSMDDIPALLTSEQAEALRLAGQIEAEMEKGCVFATEDEQRLAGSDIGTELAAVSIIEFAVDGHPLVARHRTD